MTWTAALSSLVPVLMVPIGMLIAAPLLWPLNSIINDVWQLPMLIRLQPLRTWWRLGLVSGGLLFVLDLTLRPGHVAGKLLASIVLAAWPTLRWVRVAVWRSTDGDTRSAAAAIRKEIGAREDGAATDATKPWRSFVFDVERARRRAEYEPPPI